MQIITERTLNDLRIHEFVADLDSAKFRGVTVIAWYASPTSWTFRPWGPWSEAKSYAVQIGPLFIERYFLQRCEDGAGIPGPKIVIDHQQPA